MTESEQRRPIRSYVLRTGRMTSGQERAFNDNWARWGLEHSAGLIDFTDTFGRHQGGDPAAGDPAPRVLEIGFGMGDATAQVGCCLNCHLRFPMEMAPEVEVYGYDVERMDILALVDSARHAVVAGPAPAVV